MNQNQQEPIKASQVQSILTDLAQQTGSKLVCAAMMFAIRKEPEGMFKLLDARFTVSIPHDAVTETSVDSFTDAAEKAIADFNKGKKAKALQEAICQSCKANNHTHVARSKNNRRLKDSMGVTFNLCGYKCLYEWEKNAAA